MFAAFRAAAAGILTWAHPEVGGDNGKYPQQVEKRRANAPRIRPSFFLYLAYTPYPLMLRFFECDFHDPGGVGEGVTVGDGDGTGVTVGDGDGTGVTVGDGDGKGVAVGDGAGVAVGDGAGVGVDTGVALGVGVGVGCRTTPTDAPTVRPSVPNKKLKGDPSELYESASARLM